jgi:hypothetical protein
MLRGARVVVVGWLAVACSAPLAQPEPAVPEPASPEPAPQEPRPRPVPTPLEAKPAEARLAEPTHSEPVPAEPVPAESTPPEPVSAAPELPERVPAAPKPPERVPAAPKPPEPTPPEPVPNEPVPPESSPPQPAPPAPAPPRDPTRAAAEVLRRRLGLEPGPAGSVPSGPPVIEPPAAAPPGSSPDPVAAPEPAQREPSAPPPAVAPAIAAREPTRRLDGTIATRYRARHGAGATDQDVVTRWNVDFGDPDKDAFTAHLRARGFWNADGTRRDDPFLGLDHSFGDELHARLYGGHVDLHRHGEVHLLRLGRQDLVESPVALTFDGAYAESRRWLGPTQLWLAAFAGVPVHQFEASRHGDFVAGAAAGFVPWRGGRVRLDAMHLRDEFLAVDHRDDLIALRWWQTFQGVSLRGMHSWQDGRARDLLVAADADLPGGLRATAAVRELLSTQRQQVTELDPFWTIGFDYLPYRQWEGTLRRPFGQHLVLGLGADVRRLATGAEPGPFNREFERVFADASWQDLFVAGLTLSVAASLWNATGEDVRTLTGELAYRPDRDLRLVLGSGYDLFRYDAWQGGDRLHVRSWFVRAERRFTKALLLDGGYELMRDDFDEFHVFRLGVTWTF